VKRAPVLAVVAGVLASVVVAPPAAAFTAPELFVRTQRWDTHEETGDWIPLASTQALNYLGGYEIGYRLRRATGTAGRNSAKPSISSAQVGRTR
jgi:hypothetical protein